MKLSIIVPVYLVEQYIRPCLESIFQQGLPENDFEVIVVNDGTTDNSMGVIQDIVSQHTNISVINQENQGLSVARNNGIAQAKGEYILMLDSDDLLIKNRLSPLLDKAIETKADIIVADFLMMNDEEIAQYQQHQQTFKTEEKTGQELFLEDLQPTQCYVWRSIYRREFLLINHITFIPGICFEDIPFTHEAYLRAGKCIRAHWLLNIYRRGHYSTSSIDTFSIKTGKDFCIALGRCWEIYNKTDNLPSSVKNKLKRNLYVEYCNLLYRTISKIDNISEQIEILRFFHQQAPGLNFKNSFRQKTGNWLYKLSPRLYITIIKWSWHIS